MATYLGNGIYSWGQDAVNNLGQHYTVTVTGTYCEAVAAGAILDSQHLCSGTTTGSTAPVANVSFDLAFPSGYVNHGVIVSQADYNSLLSVQSQYGFTFQNLNLSSLTAVNSTVAGLLSGQPKVSTTTSYAVTLRSILTNITSPTFYISLADNNNLGNLLPPSSNISIINDTPDTHAVTNTFNDIANWVNSTSVAPQNHLVTIKAVNNATKTFVISSSDDLNLSSVLGTGITITSDTTTASAITDTLTSIGAWLATQVTNVDTTPPPVPTNANVNVNNQTGDWTLTWTSTYPVNIYLNNTLIAPNYVATNYSRFNNPNGSYTVALEAVKPNGLVSAKVSTTFTINIAVTLQNYFYNIQLPNNANALKLVSATSYGTAASIQFPARAFTESLLMASFPAIPTTLTAIYMGQVNESTNDLNVATYLSTYFVPTTPPPTTTPPGGGFPEIQGNKFTSLITLLGAIFLFKK